MSDEFDTVPELLTPAAADNFRMTVDWGRWYIDPLPACDIAPATEDRWPSCSTVKKAADKDWSFLTVNRIAALPPAELHRIADLDHTQRGDAIRSHEKYAKNVSFGRGTIIHLWAEDLGAGRQPREITDQWLAANRYPTAARDEAALYRAAMIDFFQTYQPEPVAAEYVTIHRTLNGHGYGATPDGLFRIEREVVAVDWKTRGEGSSHAAYAEEAAQIACGARAEYMVTNRGDGAARQPLPAITGGYVVSIKPDGARLYPVDIDKAWEHWCRLHEWWVHRLTEKASIGRVLAARSKKIEPGAGYVTPDPPPALTKDDIVRMYNELSPGDQQRFREQRAARGIDNDDVAGLAQLADDIRNLRCEPEPPPPAPRPAAAEATPRRQAPDEGGGIDDIDLQPLGDQFNAMSPAANDWFADLVAQGRHGHTWEMRQGFNRTVRRYEIYRGLIHLGAWAEFDAYGADAFNDAILQPLIWEAGGFDDSILFANVTPGVALGALDVDQAKTFSQLVDDVIAGRRRPITDEQGRWRLEPAA